MQGRVFQLHRTARSAWRSTGCKYHCRHLILPRLQRWCLGSGPPSSSRRRRSAIGETTRSVEESGGHSVHREKARGSGWPGGDDQPPSLGTHLCGALPGGQSRRLARSGGIAGGRLAGCGDDLPRADDRAVPDQDRERAAGWQSVGTSRVPGLRSLHRPHLPWPPTLPT